MEKRRTENERKFANFGKKKISELVRYSKTGQSKAEKKGCGQTNLIRKKEPELVQ